MGKIARPNALLALTLAFTVGCATTATVRRTDAPPVEADIDGSDASTLRLRGRNGEMLALDQYQVASIDHPGNIVATIGAGYTGAGILCLVPLIVERERHQMDNGFGGVVGALGVLSLLVGVPMLIAGTSTWGRSKQRAHAFEISRPPPWMIAPAVPGRAEPITPIRPPPGAPDAEDPDRKPPTGFYR